MVTFWERAAHSVNRVSSLFCLFVAFVVSHFVFEGRSLVLIASVPCHCLLFTFLNGDGLSSDPESRMLMMFPLMFLVI